MDREFLAFTSKNSPWITIKEDASNKSKDPVRSTGMQWSFSNKVSNLPQFLSFKNTHEDMSRNIVGDPIGSSGYMTISTKDSFDAQTICNQESTTFSVSNQSNNQITSVLPSNLATTGINMVNSVIKSQSFGSKSSAATPLSVLPSIGSIVGSTDLRNRNCSKSNGTIPAQLTIFYGGSVCVYDDISPEKAKAIMLLAGNGTKKQPEISIPSKKDGFIISQAYPSPLPSPLPKTSHASSQQRGGSNSNNEITILRSLGPLNVPNNYLESSIVAPSIVSAPSEMIQSVCLPQARKASLTRFLEKRKERAMSTSPYYMSKKSHESSPPGSESASFSIDFSGSSSQPATNLRTTCMEV
ncbi:unnamed protein product [Lathyrus sativus]|nr:unnamed protein product [Lathyrus sativus]